MRTRLFLALLVVVVVANEYFRFSAVVHTEAPTEAPTETPTEAPTATPTTAKPTTAKPTQPRYCSDLPHERTTILPASALNKAKRAEKIHNVVVAVVTNEFRQAEMIPAIKETWGADFEHIDYFSAVPLPGLVTKVVPTNSSFARAAYEELLAWRLIYEDNPNAEWYMKTDDDAYVNSKALRNALEHFPADKDWYLGLPLKFKPPRRRRDSRDSRVVHYCAGGAGSLMSNSMMKKFYSTLQTIHLDYCCSDVQIGVNLMRLFNTSEPICTPLSPYVLGDVFYGSIRAQSTPPMLRGVSYHNNTTQYFLPLATEASKITLMHYISPHMQYVYFAMFSSIARCQAGEEDVDSLEIIIPAYGRWEREPCKQDLTLHFSCTNHEVRFFT